MEKPKGNYRETCLVIMSGLIVFWFVYEIKILLNIALAIGLIGAFIPFLAKWINWAWYKLADVLGFVMSRVMLSIVFFIFLFPIALLAKAFSKKDSLQLKKRDGSYWTEREHEYEKKDLEQVW